MHLQLLLATPIANLLPITAEPQQLSLAMLTVWVRPAKDNGSVPFPRKKEKVYPAVTT